MDSGRQEDPGEVGSGHEHHNGSNPEGSSSRGSDRGQPRSSAAQRVERGGELDRLHVRGVEERRRASVGSDGGHGDSHLREFEVLAEQYSAQLHIGPLPHPETLASYAAIDGDLLSEIVEMAKREQAAQIAIKLTPIRAEARALTVATVCVAALPVVAIVMAGILAWKGLDTAALVAGVFSFLSGGAQIIQATRRPRVVQSPLSTTTDSRQKSTSTPKQPKSKPKKRR